MKNIIIILLVILNIANTYGQHGKRQKKINSTSNIVFFRDTATSIATRSYSDYGDDVLDNKIDSVTAVTNTSAAVSYYVDDTTGIDIVGRGTLSAPWKTLEYAFASLPNNISHATKIYLGDGNYHLTSNCLAIIAKFNLLKAMQIYGQMNLVRNDFTATVADPGGNTFKRVSTVTWPSNNYYTGYVARHDNYINSTGAVYTPLGSHETTNVSSTMISEGYWVGAICSYGTNLYLDDGRTPKAVYGTATFGFNDMQITCPSTATTQLYNSGAPNILFKNVRFNVIGNYSIQIQGNIGFNHVIVMTSSATKDAVIVQESSKASFSGVFIYNSNPTASTMSAFKFTNSYCNLQKTYVYGYAYAYDFSGNTVLYTIYGHYPNIVDYVGSVFRLSTSGAVWNYGEWYGTNTLNLFNVNYMYALQGATDNIQLFFPAGRLLPANVAPLQAWFVPSTGGTWGGSATRLTALRSKPIGGYIDPTRGVIIYYPGLYPEINSMVSVSLANNSSGTINVGDITQNKSVRIEYEIDRGTSKQTGVITITNKTGTDISDVKLFDDCGVTFSKSLVGNIITLGWATSDAVSAAIFNYTITRIMI